MSTKTQKQTKTTAVVLIQRSPSTGVISWKVLEGPTPFPFAPAWTARLDEEIFENLEQHPGRREHLFYFDVRAVGGAS